MSEPLEAKKPKKIKAAKRIGKYELGATLGRGNFSKVKIATDTETGKQYAMKIVKKDQLIQDNMEYQFRREISVMKLLKSHRNVVQLYEVMDDGYDKNIYLVLELVDGPELFDRILSARKFDEETARGYFQQLIEGITYCHEQGIAHRDLKPENLLADVNGVLKICDFGLANFQGGKSLLDTQCGTPNYIAPEILKCVRNYDGRLADVWSCGVILFVMLDGSFPFDDDNLNALFNKIERADYTLPRHFSPEVANLISQMLVADPTRRITTGKIMQHSWFQVGFDVGTLRHEQIIVPTEDQVSNAIRREVSQKKQAGKQRLVSSTSPPASFGKCDTEILIEGTEDDVFAVLAEMQLMPEKTKNGIKGYVVQNHGVITYLATVVPDFSEKLALVHFKRGLGDTLSFHNLYRDVVLALGAKVKRVPTSAPSTPNTVTASAEDPQKTKTPMGN